MAIIQIIKNGKRAVDGGKVQTINNATEDASDCDCCITADCNYCCGSENGCASSYTAVVSGVTGECSSLNGTYTPLTPNSLLGICWYRYSVTGKCATINRGTNEISFQLFGCGSSYSVYAPLNTTTCYDICLTHRCQDAGTYTLYNQTSSCGTLGAANGQVVLTKNFI